MSNLRNFLTISKVLPGKIPLRILDSLRGEGYRKIKRMKQRR